MRAEKSTSWHIGVIGGSGLAAGIEIEDAQEIEVSSPFGQPSGPVTTGRIHGVRFTFLARHGKGHAIAPSQINYRANIDVLKRCGVTDVVSLSAIGSLCEEMAPGHMVMVDQFIDRTTQRANSFFETGLVAHVSMADPTCARMRAMLGEAAQLAGAVVHSAGTYVCIEGPQFSSRAESRMYQGWGGQVIGMTAMPEARLAREAELPYAVLGMVTDYDCWRAEEAGVEVSHVLQVMHANAAVARETVQQLARHLPKVRAGVPIDTALEYALVTAPDAQDPVQVRRLDAVACRLFGEQD